MRIFFAAIALLGAVASPQDNYVARDLDKISAQYLIVAPPAHLKTLVPLGDYRSKKFTVAIARTDDIQAKFGKGAEGVAKLVASAKPKFLLLAADTDQIPAFRPASSYTSERFPSDPELATDHLFGAITGRLSARSADELRVMVEKTIAYETTLAGGRWQKKIAFVTGEGGFGPLIDPILEHQFAAVVTDQIPSAYDIETAYAKPASKYCVYPPKFNDNALRMLNEGALVYAYVGHGLRDSFDDLRWNGFSYPILEAKNVGDVEVKAGLPIMVVIACYTGEYDSIHGDCIGEMLLKRPKGPVAFIGGTRITQPYGNALLGLKLVRQFFNAKSATLGEALWEAKAAVVAADDSLFRKQADAVAGLVQGPSSLEPMRKDVILHYNLLGDPALAIRRPADAIEIETHGFPGPGRTFSVTGRAAHGRVEITFECARGKFCHPVDMVGDTLEEQLTRRYAHANDKVVARAWAGVAKGEFEAEMELPKDLKPGRYVIKAWNGAAIGSTDVEIAEK